MIKWSTNKKGMLIEAKIAKRAVAMAEKLGFVYKYRDAVMDIDACHSNGCPLKLDKLLVANDINFAHDVFGIRHYLDRQTGKLTNCFNPKCSQ